MAISKIGSDGLASGSTTPSALSTGAPSRDSSGNLSFNSGYGSVATAYGCRAWVNFDGTGTYSPNPSTSKIRASGNVSSILKNGTGDYTVNFTNAMPDENYAAVAICKNSNILAGGQVLDLTTTSCRLVNSSSSNTYVDRAGLGVAIFR